MTDWVVYTGVDATLLDAGTHAFVGACAALEELRRWAIPVVLCSRRTAAETAHLQRQLGIQAPFVVEHGGAVHVPEGFFASPAGKSAVTFSRHVYTLGVEYDAILRGMGTLKAFAQDSVRGFADMSVEEVSRETGLSLSVAALAKAREFSEPFMFTRREAVFAPRIGECARAMGLRVSEGERFYLLHGDTDPGRAVRLLHTLFRQSAGAVRSIALGTRAGDASLLAAVEVPVIVPRPDGTVDPSLKWSVPLAQVAPEPGSSGWGRAVLSVLGSSA